MLFTIIMITMVVFSPQPLSRLTFLKVVRLQTSLSDLIKVPLSLLVDIGSLLYALVNVVHPDWLIRSNFRLRRSNNLLKILTKTRGYIYE